ncbi:MAG: NPCBM/NEW2 domain-containing protein, partial [bacterium]
MSKAKFATKITAVALIALAFSIAAPARQAFAAGEMALLRKSAAPPNGFWLDQIDASALKQTVGINNPGRTNEGFPIMLRGATFQHGLSLRGGGVIALDLKGDAEKFMALVGADDARMGKGAISFQVWVDGKSVVVTPFFKGGDKPQLISVDLTGAKRLALLADCRSGSPDEDHADWAGALLIMKAGATAKPALMTVVDEPAPPIA